MIIPVKTSGNKYDIILQPGAINNAGEYLNFQRKTLIVTDSGVPIKYSKCIKKQSENPVVVTIPQGEQSKSFDNYKYLLSVMTENDFTRTDCVVAVGGGVVGDLAGFAAASYMRGIDFYNVPTTVLSQVDSSVGGKTAIDFEGYKNIVGAFYQPKSVLIDPETLKTLPKRQISNGLAEALKMSLTSDEELFDIFENAYTNANLEKIIERSVKIKKNVVELDEKENGLRKILNFGHTVAHAVEAENKLSGLLHGECVSIGMLPMCSPEVRKRLIPVLQKLNLPIKTELDADALINAMKHDKKASGDKITVIFVPKIGSYEMKTIPFSDFSESIREALR